MSKHSQFLSPIVTDQFADWIWTGLQTGVGRKDGEMGGRSETPKITLRDLGLVGSPSCSALREQAVSAQGQHPEASHSVTWALRPTALIRASTGKQAVLPQLTWEHLLNGATWNLQEQVLSGLGRLGMNKGAWYLGTAGTGAGMSSISRFPEEPRRAFALSLRHL